MTPKDRGLRAAPLVIGAVVAACGASAQTPPAAARWHLVADIPLPGRPVRFDYQSIDSAAGRRGSAQKGAGEVLAFDLRTRRVVVRVPGMSGVTGVRAVPAKGWVLAALSAGHAVAVLDRRTGALLALVPGGGFPDGLAYAPDVRRLYVSDESGRRELVIAMPSARARAAIPLGGEAGNTQYDSRTGRIWVAVQTRDELAAIDPGGDSIVERIALPGIAGPHGFALDPPRGLAYVAGERSGNVGVVALARRRVLRTYPVGGDPDVVALDPARHRLYVAAESGIIAPFTTLADTLLPLARYQAPHAHSVAVDPSTGLVYVPLQEVGGRPVLRILRLE